MDAFRTLLDKMKIDLGIRANKICQDISMTVFCDNHKLAEFQADTQIHSVIHELSDDPADHVVKLVMSGKNRKHTITNDSGQIIDDVYFVIERLEFEELDLREIFCLGHKCYKHSFNGSATEFLDEFYGQLGCNGTVDLAFSTPVFLWLNQYFD